MKKKKKRKARRESLCTYTYCRYYYGVRVDDIKLLSEMQLVRTANKIFEWFFLRGC